MSYLHKLTYLLVTTSKLFNTEPCIQNATFIYHRLEILEEEYKFLPDADTKRHEEEPGIYPRSTHKCVDDEIKGTELKYKCIIVYIQLDSLDTHTY